MITTRSVVAQPIDLIYNLMIEATRGTIQRNGLSGLIFCLAQKTAVMKTIESCMGVEIVSQYDDFFLFGTAETCSLLFIELNFLILNRAKN